MPLAVKAGAVATPLAAVVAIAGLPPANVPLAPLAGGVKVTETPATGLPDSATAACRLVGKTVFTAVLCGVPAVAVRV
jgi:hypothetical protein